MARITMKTAATNTVEELYPSFLSAAAARGVRDKTLEICSQSNVEEEIVNVFWSIWPILLYILRQKSPYHVEKRYIHAIINAN